MATNEILLFLLIIVFIDNKLCCKTDNDCPRRTESQIHLCCDNTCLHWKNCSQSCKNNKDCDSSRNQICHLHRCTEDSVTYPGGQFPQICSIDADCEAGGRCEQNRCTQRSTSPPDHSERLSTWIIIVLASGSVFLLFVIGTTIYCYRRKCLHIHGLRRTQIQAPIEGPASGNPNEPLNPCIQMSDVRADIEEEEFIATVVGPPPTYSSSLPLNPPDSSDGLAVPPSYYEAIGTCTGCRLSPQERS
ncbi:predicted protein [Nematostella vectensis]|uniref:Uncharacterized protein n=1 Tax=Nematostella vectensis TaxID=45351 RepID=A7RZC2_NEMVE|nr:predicted protein [Nematostella vectensis]|eukprot:XP_001635276.1 predicted protein [Nematostella vectensis]